MNTIKPEISVLIPTFARRAYLIDALKSLQNQHSSRYFEILVLDNDCDKKLQSEIDALNTEVKTRYIPVTQLGLHNCRNVGTLEAAGELILFIDDDVIVPPDWLDSICNCFSDSKITGVGGKILPRWESNKPDWIDSVDESYFSLLDLGDESREMKWPQTPYGCNMAYRRNVIIELGGFSPDGIGKQMIEWRRGDGETGFAKKVYDKNMCIYYCAEACLYHRIPEQRVTRKYVRNKAVKNAISTFYMKMRANHYSSSKLLEMALYNFIFFSKFILKNFLKIFIYKTDMKYQITVMFYLTTTLYQLRLAIDSSLRSWVFKPDYMPAYDVVRMNRGIDSL